MPPELRTQGKGESGSTVSPASQLPSHLTPVRPQPHLSHTPIPPPLVPGPCPDQSHHIDPHVEQDEGAQNQENRVSEVLALPGVGARAQGSPVVGSLTHGLGSQDCLGPLAPRILTRRQKPLWGRGRRTGSQRGRRPGSQ